MTKRTTTVNYDAEGRVIGSAETRSTSGCSQGCGWIFWGLLSIYVLVAPAMYFGVLAIPAYVLEAGIAMAALRAWQRRQDQR